MIRRTIRMPTEAEDIEITRAAESDQDALILTNEQLAKMRSASKILDQSAEVENAAKLMRSPNWSVPASERRRLYAARRASLAVDRIICSTNLSDKLKAIRWAELWGRVARLPAALKGQ